jgi:DNA-binding LacI/PurR family transcriptional regulator
VTKTIRLRDVAEAAGVSHGTASNVFNRPEVVRKEVRERVLAAAKHLGYAGPSPMGRLLRSGKVNAIGIAAAEPLDYFFSNPWARRLLTEVADVCDARGAGLALVSVAEDQPLGWSIESALVDGFLLRCAGPGLLVEVAQKRGLPFVALSLDTAEPNVPAIDIDDFGGAQAAARHLLELGHRRIAVLGIGLGDGPGRVSPDEVRATRFLNVRERARGYWAALAEVGLPECEVPVYATGSDGWNTEAAMAVVFDSGQPHPTALLAMSDLVALTAVNWLTARGVRVPDDVSVVGFDGVPEAAVASPPLTTVEQPFRLIAERSVAAILDDALPQGREVLPLTLVVRGSTGPAAERRHKA